MKERKICEVIDVPGVLIGWGCHCCNTYNGDQRNACKHCGHERCDKPAVKHIPVQEKDGIRIMKIPTQPKSDKDIN